MPISNPPRISIALLLLLLPLSGMASPSLQRLEANGTISQVTLYQNMARVTRQIPFTGTAGSKHIVLTDLPGNLRGDSIQARGSAGLQIGSVSSQQVFSSAFSNERERTLAEQLQALRDERQTVQDQIEAALAQQAFIRSISAKPAGESNAMVDFYGNPDGWSKAWRSIGNGMTETSKVIRDAQIASRQLDADIKASEQALAQLRSNRKHSTIITIAADVNRPGEQSLQVSYDVPNASWRPVYRAALNTEASQLALTLQAELRQNTGEDWNGVNIELNTGRPSHATQLPALEPWLLRILEPRPAVMSSRNMKMLSMDAAQAAPEMSDEMSGSAVQIIEKGFAASYLLPGKQSLHSDNQAIEVAIETQTLKADMELQSVAKRDPSAFLIARFSLPEGRSFPPGKAVLTRDGDFVGNAALPDIPAGKPIEFGFGKDEKLVVEYRRLPDEAETSGFKLIGKSELITHRYVIKLHNRHQRSLPLKVIDQLPVSTDERIEVTPLWDKSHGGQPPVQDLDDRKGVVAWSWLLAAGAKQELRFGYSIKYPQGLQVPGI